MTIDTLDVNSPTNANLLSDIPPDIRNTKNSLKETFQTLGSQGGVVTVSADELNRLTGVTGNVQAQIDAKDPLPLWQRRTVPDLIVPGNERFDLAPNTRNLMNFQDFPTNSNMNCVLPDVNTVSDGDFIYTVQLYNFRESLLGFSPFDVLQTIRYFIRNPFVPERDTWQNVANINFQTSSPWPQMFFTYSSAQGQWFARIQNSAIETSAVIV